MPRDFRLQIDDILAAISSIREYVHHLSYEELSADRKTQDAVVRNLEIIGEAARTLPEDLKSRSETVDWRKIVGLRNVLIHEYFGISLPIIWDIVTNKLDGLEAECNSIMENLD